MTNRADTAPRQQDERAMGERYTPEIRQMATIAAPVFEAMRWTYGGPDNPKCPTYTDLCATIDRLIRHMADSPESRCVSSGRFTVNRDALSGLEVCLELGEVDDPNLPTDDDNDTLAADAPALLDALERMYVSARNAWDHGHLPIGVIPELVWRDVEALLRKHGRTP